MQQEAYLEELACLPDASGRNFPRLLGDLQLYIDEEGLIKPGGRIGNSLYFNIGVKHFILLEKHYPITRLPIMEAYTRCQH